MQEDVVARRLALRDGIRQELAPYGVHVELLAEGSLARLQVVRLEHRGHIKLGMTGVAEIVTDHESILSLLVRSIRQSISLG